MLILFSFDQLKNLSLPVQREAVEVRHHLADLMVDLFIQFSHEDKARKMQEARKGSVEKVNHGARRKEIFCTMFYSHGSEVN